MRVTEIRCDRCGKGPATDAGLVIGRRCDAAGSMEDVTLDADLCDPCKGAILELLLQGIPKDLTLPILRRLVSSKGNNRVFTEH